MRLFFKIWVVSSLLGGAFLSAPASAQLFNMESPLLGKKAPDFSLDTTSGATNVSMTKFREGKPAIIFFWATWCPHCREQLKVLNKQIDQIQKKNIKLILVDIGESAKQVQKHFEREKIALEVFLDKDEAVAEQYALIGVPTFFFINKEGVVKSVEHAFVDEYEEILK